MQDICNINIVESINPIINFKRVRSRRAKRKDEKEERSVCLSDSNSTLL